MPKEFEECIDCRHWFEKKQQCRDSMGHIEIYDKQKQKMVCSRFGSKLGEWK